MTTVPVTDITNDYTVTTFSEDGYPSNKNYEITTGQLSILRTVNDKLLAKTRSSRSINNDVDKTTSPEIFIPGEDSPITIIEHVSPQTKFEEDSSEILIAEQQRQQRLNIKMSGKETIIEKDPLETKITSIQSHTPSLGVMFDKDKRIKLLEEEVMELRNKQNSRGNNNIDNFTRILFGKQIQSNEINKRIAIVNYASITKSDLTLEDLEVCSEDEIDKIYNAVKQYNDSYKKRIMVTHFITIIVIVIEQILVKLGFDEMRGLSTELTSEIIDLNIGEDCEAIAVKIGIVNSPILNIIIFIIKKLITRIKIC
ncbi:SPV099 hypothetical protein [Swinepox virus]|uniref:Protein A11 n=1 Tax=Swinepox virus (strain Swine/Nebraska/17077-99/1999) TaxID=300880 RepID=Q8V3J7_SWPV1|nr:SPV099 hypothetical protein [Swinepox virus]AAL69838.1 SPV099 hypothetical protein [Swinepox virus]UED36594.1 SPV099 hypothetical protein [Swinepox virus]UED36743.1 SPV099 hypothetical protein [Swinepox virus]UUA44289.1 SPV099 [Swinepox virus]